MSNEQHPPQPQAAFKAKSTPSHEHKDSLGRAHTTSSRNVDPQETARFAQLADTWWDPHGSSRPLHLLNPLRLNYLQQRCGDLHARQIVDVGCGAGLLSEAMSAKGARVTGIDASARTLGAARLHLYESGHNIRYEEASAEEWAAQHAAAYDIVTCMELIEHVPDPRSLLAACARLVRPGGHVVLSTINRTPKAWLLAIVAAEYVLGLLPRGTHDYRRLVRPSELRAWASTSHLQLQDLCGLRFNPISEQFSRERNVDVNYLAHFTLDVDAH
ncbi:MAG: 2-polyprenyl-6-hydroxyphenyl methylase/3-demethylubiquinone-9 3-methyltransferase [Gammaproteobacteria bacterium]|jgi:2-polyprenyl-6-hydroxyphenyl methylase/3-demethylubiquinone-9 3-methyltransferase